MSQTPFDNTYLRNFKDFDSLIYAAKIIDLSPAVLVETKFGLNTDIDADTREDIWIAGGTKTVTTAAAATEILSSSVEDDPVKADESAGTGAYTATVYGWDGDYAFIQEDVTLNGTATVSLSNQFLDVYRIRIRSTGSSGSNVGNITVRHTTGPVVLGVVGPTNNITQQSHYIIPAGYTGFIQSFEVGISGDQGLSGTKVGQISFEIKYEGEPWIRSFTGGFTSESGTQQFRLLNPVTLPEKTRIKLTCLTESNNTFATSIYTIIMISNDYL